MIRIILVRHGRTAWNVGPGTPERVGQDRRFRGLIDLPLSAKGVAEAQITAERLAHSPVTAVYSSPLQRAAHTAQIIAEPHGLEIALAPGLASMDYGQWAGLSHTEVARRWPDRYQQWRHNPFAVDIPGGDSMVNLRQRAVGALRQILSRHADGESLLMVSHQVVTRTLTCAMAGMADSSYWTPRQALCNLTTFDFDPSSDAFELVGLNDTCHLNPVLPGKPSDPGTRLVLLRHGQTAWNAQNAGPRARLPVSVDSGGPAPGTCGPAGTLPGAGNLGPQVSGQAPETALGQERFRGRTDVPLDATGHAQARALCQRLQNEQITAIYTSPLLRTQQTVAPLVQALAPTQIRVQPRDGLLDIDYGEFHSLTHAEASRAYPAAFRLWHTVPSQVRFPGGEGLAKVRDRATALLEKLTAEPLTELRGKCPGETVVLAGHQIVNKVIACTLLGLDLDQIWRIRQDTGCLNVYHRVDGLWRVLRLNDSFHLREA